jgi:hypothetical protein
MVLWSLWSEHNLAEVRLFEGLDAAAALALRRVIAMGGKGALKHECQLCHLLECLKDYTGQELLSSQADEPNPVRQRQQAMLHFSIATTPHDRAQWLWQ